jgi:hypothetical protein
MIIPTISIPRIIPSVKFRQKFSVLSHLLHFHPVGGTITPLPTCCRSIAYALMFLSATRALNYSFLSALSTCKTLSITSVTCKLWILNKTTYNNWCFAICIECKCYLLWQINRWKGKANYFKSLIILWFFITKTSFHT